MNSLISFMAAALLATLDLGVLAWATKSLGTKTSSIKLALMALAVMLKFVVLVGALFLLGRQDWCDKRALLAGMVAPVTVFVIWQFVKLQSRAKSGASGNG
jgi:hypothetical protein